MDKQIPLSELIRIGSKITQQCIQHIATSEGTQTCALGAALTAKRGELIFQQLSTTDAITELGLLTNAYAIHPVWGDRCGSHDIERIITDLNDSCNWTREQIADWLQSIGR